MKVNDSVDALVCHESNIIGSVELGEGCIIHPSAVIDGGVGGIAVGKNNIVEESVRIVNRTENKMHIGNNNWFHIRCEIDSAISIGDNNSFEVGSKVNKNTRVGNNCLVSLNSTLPPDFELYNDLSVTVIGDSLSYKACKAPNQYLHEQINFLNNILRGSSMEKKG
ncbi:putative acyltransferase [Cryptosporidium canis]|uniref:Dynactin subunit 6 n=1 Tax=Cryptosporidium canis TaxID=195482 RepID=A0A9D5HX50_9CRYT|nr:putative acyltransferase [Cryptosporidium canis]